MVNAALQLSLQVAAYLRVIDDLTSRLNRFDAEIQEVERGAYEVEGILLQRDVFILAFKTKQVQLSLQVAAYLLEGDYTAAHMATVSLERELRCFTPEKIQEEE
jgi:hypothetical protein